MAEVGLTVIHVPVPTNVPPQLPVYHFQSKLSFRDPDAILNVVDNPVHNGFAEAIIVGVVALVHGSIAGVDVTDPGVLLKPLAPSTPATAVIEVPLICT